MKNKKDIKYGKVPIRDEEMAMKQAKIRITTMIDFAIYEALKLEAKNKGIKYQTLVNEFLKERYFPEKAD